MARSRPRVALVNDFEVVVAGLAAMLAGFDARLEVVDALVVGAPVAAPVDLALYDTFGRQGLEEAQLDELVSDPAIARVAIYSFNLDGTAVQHALDVGACGYLSKASPATELVDQIERLARGEQVATPMARTGRQPRDHRGWPGQDLGLTERESEVVALAALGRRNAEIADALFVSIDTVKTHLSRAFRKLAVHNRTELASLVHQNGTFSRFMPDPA